MLKKILVALDGTELSASILPYLESLLRHEDARVTLATACPAGKPAARQAAQDRLEEAAAPLRRKGAIVDVDVLSGAPAEALTAYAAGGAFDLLALCSHGRSGLKRWLLGSVAEAVVRNSTIPVLVVPPAGAHGAPSALKKMIVPLDGSHRSASALPAAVELAKAFGAKLCFVTVVSSSKSDDLPVETVAHNLFREQKALQAAGLEVEVAVLYGDPAERILAFAEQNGADLIALSSHGRSGMAKVRFGSVAQTLLRHGKRPLLIVRTAAFPKTRGRGAKGMAGKHRALQTMNAMAFEVKKSPYSR